MNGEKEIYSKRRESSMGTYIYKKWDLKIINLLFKAFLIHEDQFKGHNTVEREYGRTLGMRVARLGHTIYRGLEVNRSQIIGLTKPPLQRGLRSAMKVFF